MSRLSVALVEDNDGDALIIEELFDDRDPGGAIELTRATSISELDAVLADGLRPDCVLLDLGLPDAAGTQAVEAVARRAPDLPIVVLTGSNDPDLARDALRAGAQDYLVKGAALDEEVARRAIRYAIERAGQLRALRASRRELRDFAHRVAHDLKSPLSVVIGLLDLLRQQEAPDEQVAGLYEMAARSSQRLVEMVDRLLEYADTAGSDSMLAPVGLDTIVEWVRETLGATLDDVTLEIDGLLPKVHANEVGLRHVFLNLISNSIQYAHPERAAEIVIRVVDESTERVVIAVSDNGRGIPDEHRPSIFDAGYRVADDEHGTGLGLATVRRTVELVGGSVAVDDGPSGVGTTFHLTLPTHPVATT